MTGRFKVILALVLTAASILSAVFLYQVERNRQREVNLAGTETVAADDVSGTTEPDVEKASAEIYLYSPNSQDPGRPQFYVRTPEVSATDSPEARGREIVGAVLSASRGLVPQSVRVLEFYIMEDGTAVVDLSREVSTELKGSVEAELGLLRSLTRSLRENVPQVRRVRFVVAGMEQPTLAGHVSIQTPFR